MDSKLISKVFPRRHLDWTLQMTRFRNLRSRRGVDVHLSFLRLGRSGRRWVYHRDVALFFFRRRIRHGRFLLLTSREQRNASEQTNIFSHVSGSNLRMNLVVFKESPLNTTDFNVPADGLRLLSFFSDRAFH
jgi:hypothetical protein